MIAPVMLKHNYCIISDELILVYLIYVVHWNQFHIEQKTHDTLSLLYSSRYYRIMDKQRLIDENEVETLQNNKKRYLYQAVENYMKSLQRGDRHNLRVFRLTSLWFDNCNQNQLNGIIKVAIICM